LSHLLDHPPEEGGRNNWLAQVAGHYAAHIPHQDAYEAMVRQAAAPLGLEDAEVDKLIRSIWQSERSKVGKAIPVDADPTEGGDWRIAQPEEESGWLVSGDTRILVQIRERDAEGNASLALSAWASADFRAIAVVVEEDEVAFDVEIRRSDGTVSEAVLPAAAFGSPVALNTWLANHGVVLYTPDTMHPSKMNAGSRLAAYLRAQNPPQQQFVHTLGWSDELSGFVTPEGVLKVDGFHQFDALRPHPSLKSRAPYRYGLEGEEYEARMILNTLMTFHDERVCAVFGSWWAACLLKPQIMGIFSQFPVMALQAPSESGKSTGFFPLMLQLSGNTQGEGISTKAALRDYLSAHRNGIVWLDDLDNLENHWELIRGTTVGGSVAKKALNQSDQVSIQLNAALAISGEALGLKTQKALADRSVALEVPSPVGRPSHHGDYVQWQDIVELRRRYPDLTDYSGTLVRRALGLVDKVGVEALKLRAGSGRTADKLTIVRIGAWVLRDLMGNSGSGWVTKYVDEWVEEQLSEYSADDNALTLEILPRCLSDTGWKTRPEGPDPVRRQLATPVFITQRLQREDGKQRAMTSDTGMWFSPQLLSHWWKDMNHGRVEVRTSSEEALTEQARAIGAGGKKGVGRRHFDFVTGGGGRNYWRMPDELAEVILRRSKA
jgi:hypothetical protein